MTIKPGDCIKTLLSGRTGKVIKVFGDGSASICWDDCEPPYGRAHERVSASRIAVVAPPVPQQAPYTCGYCGGPSWIDPSDQSPPPDYCHDSDHGTAF